MKANPGGSIHPNAIVGRDLLITQIWKRLEQQCVLLNAERRIGKTSVVKKMVAEPPAGWFGVYQDLEDIKLASDFAVAVHEEVQKFLSKWSRAVNAAKDFYDAHDFGDLTKRQGRPWKELLTAAIKDLIEAKPQERLVLFWDEVPYMIANIAKAEGEQTAAEVLDTLRRLRNQYPDLRMVFTGSIGLHHVLASLHAAGIASEPVNDMASIEVTPLAPADAIDLARKLIEGEKLKFDHMAQAAEAITGLTDCFPFYIQHVVSSLAQDQLPAHPEQVRELVQRHLVDANDPWELGHFRTRIPIYYRDPRDAKLVGLLLDALSVTEGHRSLNELQSDINSQTDQLDDRDLLVRVLHLMERDHYITRDTGGRYQFRFPLIRRWWKLDRGL